jgi:hypothetical protein
MDVFNSMTKITCASVVNISMQQLVYHTEQNDAALYVSWCIVEVVYKVIICMAPM